MDSSIERMSGREREPETPGSTAETVRETTSSRLGIMETSSYLQTGDPQHLDMAMRSLNTTQELANRHKTTEEMIAAKDRLLTKEDIDALPSLPGKLSISSEGREQQQLREIKQRLQATASLQANDIKRRRPADWPDPYLVPHQGAYKLKRDLVEKDLAFLSDPSRIDANPSDEHIIPKEREAVFRAYRRLLSRLVTLSRPVDEERYRNKYGTVLEPKQLIEDHCRKTPEEIKNASKFVLLLAGSALLTLSAVIDFRNEDQNMPSLATLGFLGGVLYLLKNGSKFDFMKPRYFAEMAQKGLDGAAVKKIQNLSRAKPQAVSHMISVFEDRIGREDAMSQDTIDQLIHPTKTRNGQTVPDTRKAVPKDIAQVFLGQSPGAASKVVRGLKKTARSRDRDLVAQFAEANHNNANTQNELAALANQTPAAQETAQ